jgi:hypothetical protein
MYIDDFIKKMKEIKNMSFVVSHRIGDTGIGKTLEDLLGIVENNIAGPDFDIYELKSARKGSVSMLTLFTKSPQPKGANQMLLNEFGYKQRSKLTTTLSEENEIVDLTIVHIKEKELHVTLDSIKRNSVGLKLKISGNVLYLDNEKGIEVFYTEDYLRKAFENKYRHKLAYVLAESIKVRGQSEKFWFNELYILEEFDFLGFSELVKNGIIKLDIRIGHYPDGRSHDHGTGFRIFPKSLPDCFKNVRKIEI